MKKLITLILLLGSLVTFNNLYARPHSKCEGQAWHEGCEARSGSLFRPAERSGESIVLLDDVLELVRFTLYMEDVTGAADVDYEDYIKLVGDVFALKGFDDLTSSEIESLVYWIIDKALIYNAMDSNPSVEFEIDFDYEFELRLQLELFLELFIEPMLIEDIKNLVIRTTGC